MEEGGGDDRLDIATAKLRPQQLSSGSLVYMAIFLLIPKRSRRAGAFPPPTGFNPISRELAL
jgi:hypothetical protein